MQIIYTDVLVVGAGLAGQRAAIGAKRRGHDTIVLSLVPAKRSHSAAAQGGMQASLGNCLGASGDNDARFGIIAVEAAYRLAGLADRFIGYGTGVDDDNIFKPGVVDVAAHDL